MKYGIIVLASVFVLLVALFGCPQQPSLPPLPGEEGQPSIAPTTPAGDVGGEKVDVGEGKEVPEEVKELEGELDEYDAAIEESIKEVEEAG